jgi:hypothetical protein
MHNKIFPPSALSQKANPLIIYSNVRTRRQLSNALLMRIKDPYSVMDELCVLSTLIICKKLKNGGGDLFFPSKIRLFKNAGASVGARLMTF